MIILTVLICWICICFAKRTWPPPFHNDKLDRFGPNNPTCIPNDPTPYWRPVPWHLSTNYFIEYFNNGNRPWRHPLNIQLIKDPAIPPGIALPNPLLPTDDVFLLKLYSEAILTLIDDSTYSDFDKNRGIEIYAADMYCWEADVECQGYNWLLGFPWWACRREADGGGKGLGDWWGKASKVLDGQTISLLKRSYRYALIDLGNDLVSLISRIGSPRHLKRGSYPEGAIIPKFAKYSQSLMDFFLDPVHQAEMVDVRRPHLPGHIVPPSPLLSTVDNVFSADNKTFLKLYQDALNAYDRDQKLSVDERHQNWQNHQTASWEWITHDPCFYNRDSCNSDDFYGRIFGHGWFTGHIEAGKALKATMEEQGLVGLGKKLLAEAKQSAGDRGDLDRLLNDILDMN